MWSQKPSPRTNGNKKGAPPPTPRTSGSPGNIGFGAPPIPPAYAGPPPTTSHNTDPPPILLAGNGKLKGPPPVATTFSPVSPFTAAAAATVGNVTSASKPPVMRSSVTTPRAFHGNGVQTARSFESTGSMTSTPQRSGNPASMFAPPTPTNHSMPGSVVPPSPRQGPGPVQPKLDSSGPPPTIFAGGIVPTSKGTNIQSRATPPPSPRRGGGRPQLLVTTAPTTPLITNTSPSASSTASGGYSTGPSGTPTGGSASSIRRRPLKLPPKAQISPRTNRPKFKLPPARKPRGSSPVMSNVGAVVVSVAVEEKIVPSIPNMETPKPADINYTPDLTAKVETIPSMQGVESVFAETNEPPVQPEKSESLAPSDWVELEDHVTGRVYYFNSITQETRWDKPDDLGSEMPTESQGVETASGSEVKVEHPISSESNEEGAMSVKDEDALPEGWEALVDISSGKTYYYNSSTQETSWETPISKKVDIPVEIEDVSVEEPKKSEVENQQPASSTSLPAPWSEETDPQTGEVFYFNNNTKQTSWELPLFEENPDAGAAVESTSVSDLPVEETEAEKHSPQDDQLPAGWVAELDVASGNTYYVNAETQETTWERPSANSAEADVNAEGEDILESTTVTEPSNPELEIEESEEPASYEQAPETSTSTLPDDWTEVVDPNGQVYYYNSRTQETAWELPTQSLHADEDNNPELSTNNQVELSNDSRNQDDDAQVNESEPVLSGTTNNPESTSTVDLPRGWIEREDEVSGSTYFYNTETEETRWERPVRYEPEETSGIGGSAVSGARSESPETQIEQVRDEAAQQEHNELDDNAKENDEPDDLPWAWTECIDSASGQVYYFNTDTEETTWDKPAAEPSQELLADDDVAIPTTTGSDISPENEVAIDESHEIEDMANHSVPSSEGLGQESDDTGVSATENEDKGDQDSTAETMLLPGWSETVDPASGQPYYVNDSTQETTWDRPEVAAVDGASDDDGVSRIAQAHEEQDGIEGDELVEEPEVQPEEHAPTKESELPQGWIEVSDPASDSVYYFNEVTQETRWDLPEEEPMPQEPIDELVIGNHTLSANDEATGGVAPEEVDEVVAEDTGPIVDDSSDLPEGWTKVTDPSSENVYYYNEITEETSWDRPEDVSAAVSQHESDRVEDDFVSKTETVSSESPTQENQDAIIRDVSDGEDAPATASNVDLPDGWAEVVDPNTDEVYYYNELSQETSWDRPTSILANQNESSENEVESEEKPVAVHGEVTSSPNPEPSPILPVGWSEITDPNSGSVYYYNETTQETSWDMPSTETVIDSVDEPAISEIRNANERETSDVDKDHSSQEEEVALPDDDAALPQDWAMMTDPASGDVYYYNQTTDQTSWEKPSSVATNETEMFQPDEQDDDAIKTENISGEDDNDVTSHEQGTSEELPVGWVVVKDPSTGDAYYYNEVSQETSWDFPSVSTAADVIATENSDIQSEEKTDLLDPHSSTGMNVTETEVTGVDSALPEGWMKVVAQDSDEVYYYNEATQETSWTSPLCHTDSGMASSNVESEVFQQQVVGDDANEDVFAQERNDQGETAEDLPISEAPMMAGPSPGGDTGDSPQNETPWIEMTDPNSGNTYYFNATTEETSWEKPIDYPSESSEQDDDGEEPSEQLLDGWSEMVDPASGRIYYINKATQDTSWEKPLMKATKSAEDEVESKVESEVKHVAESSLAVEAETPKEGSDLTAEPDTAQEDVKHVSEAEPELLEEWVQVEDPDSGTLYYYNELTQETSWDRPKDSKVNHKDKELKPDENVSGETEGTGTAPDELVDDITPTEDAVMVMATSSSPKLPEGWVEVSDPNSGSTYYYHEATQETSWGMPESTGRSTPARFDKAEEIVKAEPTDDDEDVPNANDLPENWEKCADPSTGKTYYFNSKTEETKWTLLESTQVHITDEEPDDVDGNVSGEVQKDEAVMISEEESRPLDEFIRRDLKRVDSSSLVSLPEGWLEEIDQSTGQVYFFNSITQATSWERPASPGAQKDTHAKEEEQMTTVDGVPTIDSKASAADTYKQNGIAQGVPQLSWEELKVVIVDREEIRRQASICGSMVSASDAKVLSYVKKKAQGSKELLWKLIYIAVKCKGRLRSVEGADSTRSPESAIVKLLLSAEEPTNEKKNENEVASAASPAKAHRSLAGSQDNGSGEDTALALQDVQDLIVKGRRVEAARAALNAGDFATALLVSSMSDHITFREAAKQYIEHSFQTESPLYTVSMLFYGDFVAPSSRTAGRMNWGGDSRELLQTWRRHLAAILSNRTAGWELIVQSFGDRLQELGSIEAAHFCFMVSSHSIANPTDESCRIAIIGCDHHELSSLELKTTTALEAYDRTEAYEWAKRLGNRRAAIQSLQCFKVVYAKQLIRCDLQNEAKNLVQSIRRCVNLKTGSNDLAQRKTTTTANDIFSDTAIFESTLIELENELGISMHTTHGAKSSSQDPPSITRTLQKEPPLSLLSTTNKKQDAVPAVEKRPLENEVNGHQLPPVGEIQSAPTQAIDSNSAPDDAVAEVSFVTAKSNLMDRSGYSLSTPESPEPRNEATKVPEGKPKTVNAMRSSASVPPIVPGNPIQAPKYDATKRAQSVPPPRMLPSPARSQSSQQDAIRPGPTPVRIPPSPGRSLERSKAKPAMPTVPPKIETKTASQASMAGKTPMLVTPKNEETPKKIKKAPATAPAALDGKKSASSTPNTRPSPSSSGSGGIFSRFKGKMVSLLNPDAHQVSLEENSEKAYYDEQRKVWVFPGENPDEVSRPVGPPPTAASASTPTPQPKLAENDPLAAMMAPPSRAPSSLRRAGVPGTPRGYPGTPGSRPVPASGSSPVVRPPQFAVFQPKPTAKSTTKPAAKSGKPKASE